ncbi:MAG: FtsX-like permease family protein, partial [Clostridioides sp.]|nr:FtsX-like permease family protein [Clostridioides sp.]
TKQNETLQKQSDYKKVILVNNIYSRVTNSFDTSVIKGAKVGDTIDIKLPVHKDNVEKYENFKVQVAGITNKTYIATQDGEPQFKGGQVIFREDDYRELTGQKDCNKLYIMSNENTIDEVEKNLMSLVKDSSFTSIGGKNEDNKYLAGLRSSEDRLDFIYQILIIFILVVNIAFIIRSNIITRTKELSILRAVGMKKEKLRKMIILESELYGVISVIVSSVIATILYNKRIMNMNNINLSAGYVRTVGFNIPFKAILIVAVISIAMCYMSVYFSKGKIEGISIIEGISEE